MVDQIAGVLEKMLASRNIKGSVAHQLLQQATGDGMTMQFSLENSPLRVQSVQFGDALATDSERLKDRLGDLKGQPYSRFAIELFENEQIRPVYSSKGFLRAQIGPAVAHLSSEAGNPPGAAVDVQIPITPGAVYTWKGVSWQGNTAFPSPMLDATMQMKAGDVADGMKIERDWQNIETGYARRGYLDMKLKPQAQFDDAAHQVSYRQTSWRGRSTAWVRWSSRDSRWKQKSACAATGSSRPAKFLTMPIMKTSRRSLQNRARVFSASCPCIMRTFGHWLRPNADKHTVDVLLDFK